MATLNQRLNDLEADVCQRLDEDPYEIVKENGFEKGLAILEAMGNHAAALEIRELAARAREKVRAWEIQMFGQTNDAVE